MKKPVQNDTFPSEERCLLAHDINNDLTVITGCCELLGDRVLSDPESTKHVHFILEAVEHMSQSIAKSLCRLLPSHSRFA